MVVSLDRWCILQNARWLRMVTRAFAGVSLTRLRLGPSRVVEFAS